MRREKKKGKRLGVVVRKDMADKNWRFLCPFPFLNLLPSPPSGCFFLPDLDRVCKGTTGPSWDEPDESTGSPAADVSGAT